VGTNFGDNVEQEEDVEEKASAITIGCQHDKKPQTFSKIGVNNTTSIVTCHRC